MLKMVRRSKPYFQPKTRLILSDLSFGSEITAVQKEAPHSLHPTTMKLNYDTCLVGNRIILVPYRK